ncbi:hypothetical protein GGQ97_002514 [Sphingomonas kaistensis]|uniref:Uncharacterized protein n=1 Tax=Sphingomonas kaistensis TaxID=298708 RepID=A0A7X5Y822_9SPHN|nr:hypothetical protein [Sphingomonas kaistensis]NJC06721.1 hypothetical protein [Sphingomonas kaistensis]
MLTSNISTTRNFNPSMRGYHAVYRENAVNHCPGCGRTHWLIGRMLAECGFCGTALPLSESYSRSAAAPLFRHGTGMLSRAA